MPTVHYIPCFSDSQFPTPDSRHFPKRCSTNTRAYADVQTLCIDSSTYVLYHSSMQPHVSPPHLHFPPARPPRSEPAQLSPGCPSDLLPASLFNSNELVPPVFQSAPLAGVLRICSPSRIPCFLLLRAAREVCISAFLLPVNILIPSRSHSRQTYIALGIPFRLSNSGTLRSLGYPQVLFEPHLNSHPAIAQCGVSKTLSPILRIPHRRESRYSPWIFKCCTHRRYGSPMPHASSAILFALFLLPILHSLFSFPQKKCPRIPQWGGGIWSSTAPLQLNKHART